MLNKEGVRGLVNLRVVDQLLPITFLNAEKELEEAANIELAKFGGWQVIVKKGQFEEGNLAVYCELDTVLNKDIPLFAFLEGKRIKTKKLKGVISQGVAFTIPEILDVIYSLVVNEATEDSYRETLQVYQDFNKTEFNEGDDWTELVGAKKYDEYSSERGGNNAVKMMPTDARGKFPSFIPKTDEERVQNLAKDLKYDYVGEQVIAREKLHGSSITIYAKVDKPHPDFPAILDFGICSRNFELKISALENTYVSVGLPYLKELLDYCMNNYESIALQGEMLGPGINGNPYNLEKHTIRWFTARDINEKYQYTDKELCELLTDLSQEFEYKEYLDSFKEHKVNSVPEFLPCPFISLTTLSGDMSELLTSAEGKSALYTKYDREGIVVRAIDGSFSFKVINNKWLLKEKD